MKLFFQAGFLSLLLFVLLACSDGNSESTQTDEEIAEDLWQQIQDESFNTQNDEWTTWPGKTGIYVPDTTLIGADPHRGPDLMQIFINSNAEDGISAKSFPLK